MAANSRFAVATHLLVGLGYFAKHPESAVARPDGTVSSSLLAGSVRTHPVVVRRLLADLSKAGLVRTRPGKQGGAALARPAGEITLLDVLEAVGEGSVFGANPNPPNSRCPVSRCIGGALEPVFESVSQSVRRQLEKVRLSELVAKVH